MTAKNKTMKFISAFLIILIILPTVLFSKPQKSEAQWITFDPIHNLTSVFNGIFQGTTSSSTVINTGISIKNVAIEIGKQLLKVFAKRVLAQMTQATINWINSGFHGSPLFIENPESFFRDIAKTQVKSIVDMIGYDTFRFPFGKQTALNVISSYQGQLATNAQYTLSKVINDPDLLVQYRNDFNYGGWNGFLINTQYPQNNYLGFQGIIQQNLASRLEGTLVAPAQKVQNLLQQGMGFLSPQTCPSNPNYPIATNPYNPPSFTYNVPFPQSSDVINPQNDPAYTAAVKSWNEGRATAKAAFDAKYSCPKGLVNTTPGSVAANQVFSALNTPFLTTALDGALGNSLAAIFDALINKLVGTGLNALSNTVNPGSATDNWSYNGQTLDGTNLGYASPTGETTVIGALDINIPQQNVSLTTGYNTSKTLTGGTAPYTVIQTTQSVNIAPATITRSTTSSTLTINGKARGSTSITVQDSSTPRKTVTINIRVSNIGELVAIPENISINVNETAVTNISGGEGSYSISQKSPNFDTIAITEFAGTNLIVTGIAKNTVPAWIEIKDSSVPAKIVRVNVAVNAPGNLVITQQNIPVDKISMETGKDVVLQIADGTPSYIVDTVVDSTVASAQIGGTTLLIHGISAGQSAVVIRDSSNPFKIASLSIIVTAGPEQQGTCTVRGVTTTSTKAGCDAQGPGAVWQGSGTTGSGSNAAPQGRCQFRAGTVDFEGGRNIDANIQTDEATCKNNIGGTWTPYNSPSSSAPNNNGGLNP